MKYFIHKCVNFEYFIFIQNDQRNILLRNQNEREFLNMAQVDTKPQNSTEKKPLNS